jgi:WD40 repeat protein
MGIAYSPQGDLLVSAGDDCTVRLWDVETGECRQISIGHTKGIRVVVYSPQGSQAATGSADGSVRIWDMATRECLYTLTGHTKGVTCVEYSSKGDYIVSGSENMTARLWDATSGQCRAVVESIDSSIQSIVWSTTSDVDCFVIGCYDGSVSMWQVVKSGDTCHVRQRWRTVNGELVLTDTLIQGVRGLSQLNKQLLKQRGAKGEPYDQLREASTKVMQMASVVSALKQPLEGAVPESASTDNLTANLSDHPEHPEHPETSAQSDQPVQPE